MMSGLVTPQSIGLNDEKSVFKLLKISKKLFIISRFVYKYNFPFTGLFGFFPYLFHCDLYDIILIGIPSTFFTGFIAYYGFAINLWYLIHFYIISYYLRLKIRSINECLNTTGNGYQIIRNFNRVYREIQKYNEIFLSKYLLFIWLSMGAMIANTIFMSLLISFDFIMKISIIHGTIILSRIMGTEYIKSVGLH